LPGEAVSDDAQKQKMRAHEHAFRESLSLIRSILIDSGPPTASRARFFRNYFCTAHEADRRAKILLQKHVFASRIARSRVHLRKSDEQITLISSRYLQHRYFRAVAAGKRVVKRRSHAIVDACEGF
jgi:hypothetical protein